MQHPAAGGQLARGGGGEEVVRRHANPDRASELLAHDEVQQTVVVGVHLLLVRVGGRGPALGLPRHLLHGQVCALDDPDLDGSPARGHPPLPELPELPERVEGIREVGLKHDPAPVGEELFLVEQLLKQPDRELEVVILLHVEVDEHPLRVRRLVQGAQAVLEARDRAVVVPVVDLRHHRGGLHRHVGHARVVDEVQGASGAGLGLLLADHGLAQQVEVELLAAGRGLVQHGVERVGLGVEDEVPD